MTGFAGRLDDVLAALRGATSWLLTEEDTGRPDRVHAGADGEVAWYQRTADGPDPAVYVADGAVLVRDTLSYDALGWKGSLTRLERAMAGRSWVRVPLAVVEARDPGVLPAGWAARAFTWTAWDDVVRLDPEADPEPAAECYRAHDEYGRPSTWRFATDGSGLAVDWAYGEARLTFPGVACPFDPPDAAEVVDAATVTARRRPTDRITGIVGRLRG